MDYARSSAPTDSELLKAARRDPDAFCAFYDRHATRLHAWLLRETSDFEVATDLTAETFAQALRSLRRFRGDSPESGRAWLYAIARHLLARYRETARASARSTTAGPACSRAASDSTATPASLRPFPAVRARRRCRRGDCHHVALDGP